MSTPTESEHRKRVLHQKRLGHHIPDVLIERTKNLKKVKYRKILIAFANTYSRRGFETIEQEFALIKRVDSRLLDYCFKAGSAVGRELDRMMRGDIMASKGVTAYRDHFIHSFQDFLAGIVIIDNHYSEFVRRYSISLNKDKRTGLECAWLLTAIFHDRYKGLLKITESLGGQLEPPERNPLYKFYLHNLASIYQHLLGGKPLESWVPSNRGFTQHSLFKVLEKHSTNHGVRGAIELLNLDLQSTIGNPVVYSAALAIALHNGNRREKLRTDLLGRKIFPIKFKHFLIVGLFLYCDAVQEWNRSPESKDELVDIVLEKNKVCFTMQFSSIKSNEYKTKEFYSVSKCVRFNALRFGFTGSFFMNAAQ